jgi:hypothetical protein
MKILTAGTTAEKWTGNLLPVRTCHAETHHLRPRKIFLRGGDFGDEFLPRQSTGDEDHFAVDTGQSVTAENALFDFALKFLSGFHIAPQNSSL